VGIKIDKIIRIFDNVENIKDRGVTYWANSYTGNWRLKKAVKKPVFVAG
jgi:hypothetical protein